MTRMVKIKFFFAFLWLFSFASTAFPCANMMGRGTKYSGEKSSVSARLTGYPKLKAALNQALMTDGAAMESELRSATEFTNRNDYCVALMYLGRSQEAVVKLTELESERPGTYYVAANLGTAYELVGNNQEALRWIQEGIHRNPASHEGTEWLHAKILESKIFQQADPAFFEKHSVLELNPAQVTDSMIFGSRTLSARQIAEAIQHQLEERLQFVKPPDPAVASLLFDYAAIEAATRSMESAQRILQLAAEYGYPKPKIETLKIDFGNRLAWRRTKDRLGYAAWGLLGIGILWFLYKRKIFVLSRRDL